MKDTRAAKAELIKRRDEIFDQLERTNKDLSVELDPKPEDQAIQIEQDEVAVAIERNLRKELGSIEEKLAEFGD